MAKPMCEWSTKELRAELARLHVDAKPQWNKVRLRREVWAAWDEQAKGLFSGPHAGGFTTLPFACVFLDDHRERTFDGRAMYERTHGDKRAILVRMLATHFASFWPEVADVIEVQR